MGSGSNFQIIHGDCDHGISNIIFPCFIQTNTAEPYEMSHVIASHLGLKCRQFIFLIALELRTLNKGNNSIKSVSLGSELSTLKMFCNMSLDAGKPVFKGLRTTKA